MAEALEGRGASAGGRGLAAPAQCALLREAEATRRRKDGRLPGCGRGNRRLGDGKRGGREFWARVGVGSQGVWPRPDVGGGLPYRPALRGDPARPAPGGVTLPAGWGENEAPRAAVRALGVLRPGRERPRRAPVSPSRLRPRPAPGWPRPSPGRRGARGDVTRPLYPGMRTSTLEEAPRVPGWGTTEAARASVS